jgi:hypothetical protein
MRHGRRSLLLLGWLLVQKPTEWTDPTDPPIEKWKQVKRFGSEQDCQAYRNEALIVGAEMGSSAMEAQADSYRCVRDGAAAATTSTTTP